MSKRTRKNKTEGGAGHPSEAKVQTTAVPEASANLAPSSEPQEQLLNIEEAARDNIVGYQSRWLPSIKAFAATHSRSENHTAAEWRSLFSMWGAQLK